MSCQDRCGNKENLIDSIRKEGFSKTDVSYERPYIEMRNDGTVKNGGRITSIAVMATKEQ